LASDQPSNRKAEDFYDNSLLEELAREGFIKAATNKRPGKTAARRSLTHEARAAHADLF
jgi:hypothetical protein